MNKTVTILCSGVALGVYIPAVALNYRLKQNGVASEVVVLENLIVTDKKDKIKDNKKAFHQNFSLALKGQKMAKDIMPSIDQEILEEMFKSWKEDNRRDFIVFSGFWMTIIDEYKIRIAPEKVNVDIIHVDSEVSPSWKSYKKEATDVNTIWLVNYETKSLVHEIFKAKEPPIPFNQREDRLVIHGGGWGMGTYQSRIPELEQQGFSLNIMAYYIEETDRESKNNRYFMVDPSWHPWLKNEKGEHTFPPFGEIKEDKSIVYDCREEYHGLFYVIANSKAIISKPGGSTLVDSLESATPIIFLDPFGEHEKRNCLLWEELGFGISYDKWKASGYSAQMLEEMHLNLLKAKGTLEDYPDKVTKRLIG